MAIKHGGGDKALMARPLREELATFLSPPLERILKIIKQRNKILIKNIIIQQETNNILVENLVSLFDCSKFRP